MNIWHDMAPEAITPSDFMAVIEIPDGSTADAEIFKCLDTIEINGKQAEAELKNGKWYFKLTAGKYTIKA